MEERDALTIDPAQEAAEPAGESGSPMERLRELRRRTRDKVHLTLEVPGYDGELAVRYKAVPRDELLKPNKRKDDIDLLIFLCESICVRGREGWEPLEDEAGPVRFDERLAKYLEVEITGEHKARECLEGVFSLDVYPLSPTQHAKRLFNWMRGVDAESDEALLGE